MSLANASTINMTKIPPAAEEGSAVEYVCETDYAYPEVPDVLWFVDANEVNYTLVTEVNYRLPGSYHGQMTKSSLRLAVKREMNNRTVKCVLKNNRTKYNKHNLSVTCRYL